MSEQTERLEGAIVSLAREAGRSSLLLLRIRRLHRPRSVWVITSEWRLTEAQHCRVCSVPYPCETYRIAIETLGEDQS